MVEVNGAQLHVARTGQGRPLLLLHGWPGFWFTWKPIMERLSDRFELIAPDLRGFGDSDKPVGDFGPEDQASNTTALIDSLDVGPVGIVSHDVGGSVAQVLARQRPEQIAGLFFSNFLYPGIGDRFNKPNHLKYAGICFSIKANLRRLCFGVRQKLLVFLSPTFSNFGHITRRLSIGLRWTLSSRTSASRELSKAGQLTTGQLQRNEQTKQRPARSLRRSLYLLEFAEPNAIKHLNLSGRVDSVNSSPIWITSRFLTPGTSRITNNPSMPPTR